MAVTTIVALSERQQKRVSIGQSDADRRERCAKERSEILRCIRKTFEETSCPYGISFYLEKFRSERLGKIAPFFTKRLIEL